MGSGIVSRYIRVVALRLVVAGCSPNQQEAVAGQDALEGALPDGTVFALVGAEIDPLDAVPDGIILIDVPGGQV